MHTVLAGFTALVNFMKYSPEEICAKVLIRDVRAVARMLTRIEAGDPIVRDLASALRRPHGKAHVIGVTGAPGAGKSTLVDQLAVLARKSGQHVAVLAVDPSSPFTGGAILGDRIRMSHASEDKDVFIRSMATRGSLGGLSRATLEAVHVLDAAGFDLIIVETVGVGQAEVDIVRTADTCLVVLVPGMGDSVQIIKAGLIEIADIFIINKADRDGVNSLEKDLLTLLTLVESPQGAWRPRVMKTVSTTGEGVASVLTESVAHKDWLEASSLGQERRIVLIAQMLRSLAGERIAGQVLQGKDGLIRDLAKECVLRVCTPLQAIEKILSGLGGPSPS
jgi:LAO/AO transport system kinase